MSGEFHTWWISFCSANGENLGVCVVNAEDPMGALRSAWSNGCNPGGEAAVMKLSKEEHERFRPHRNKLLTKEQAVELFGPMEKMPRAKRAGFIIPPEAPSRKAN